MAQYHPSDPFDTPPLPASPALSPPLQQQLATLAANSGLSQDQLLDAALALWHRQRLR